MMILVFLLVMVRITKLLASNDHLNSWSSMDYIINDPNTVRSTRRFNFNYSDTVKNWPEYEEDNYARRHNNVRTLQGRSRLKRCSILTTYDHADGCNKCKCTNGDLRNIICTNEPCSLPFNPSKKSLCKIGTYLEYKDTEFGCIHCMCIEGRGKSMYCVKPKKCDNSYDDSRASDDDTNKPSDGNSRPDNGNIRPDNGNNRPDDGNNRPDNGNNKPSDGHNRPDDGNNRPDNGNNRPDNGNNRPDNGNNKPSDGNNWPDNGNNRPDNGNKRPDSGNNKPSDGNNWPDNGNNRPDKSNNRPDSGNNKPSDGSRCNIWTSTQLRDGCNRCLCQTGIKSEIHCTKHTCTGRNGLDGRCVRNAELSHVDGCNSCHCKDGRMKNLKCSRNKCHHEFWVHHANDVYSQNAHNTLVKVGDFCEIAINSLSSNGCVNCHCVDGLSENMLCWDECKRIKLEEEYKKKEERRKRKEEKRNRKEEKRKKKEENKKQRKVKSLKAPQNKLVLYNDEPCEILSSTMQTDGCNKCFCFDGKFKNRLCTIIRCTSKKPKKTVVLKMRTTNIFV